MSKLLDNLGDNLQAAIDQVSGAIATLEAYVEEEGVDDRVWSRYALHDLDSALRRLRVERSYREGQK